MLPLRSVGRSNFVMVCVSKFNNVDSKATYYENCCVIYTYIYIHIYIHIHIQIYTFTAMYIGRHMYIIFYYFSKHIYIS